MSPSLAALRALPHLSISQLKVFLQCPRKYRLQYVDHVEPRFRPIALAFGSAWHEAIGHHLLTSTKTQASDRDEVRTIFRDHVSAAVAADHVPVLFGEDDDLGTTIDLGLRMIDAFVERVAIPDRVVGVEVPFSLHLIEPDFGEILQFPLIGALDAIVVDDGVPAVWELKTSKKKWSSDQLDFDLQPTAYSMAAEQLGYEDADVVLVVTTKTQAPEVQIERLTRATSDRDDLAATAVSAATAIAVGIDHPVRGWACRGCPYAHACR